jgi:hypothetical protein
MNRKRSGWLPGFVAAPLLFVIEQLGKMDQSAEANLDKKLKPSKDDSKVFEVYALLALVRQVVSWL